MTLTAFNSAQPGAARPAAASAEPTAAAAPLPCTPLRGRPLDAAAKAPAVDVHGVLNRDGEQTGRRFSLAARRGAQVTVSLPADSFVGQPAGDWLVYGAAGRRESEVRAVDLETGCDTRLVRVPGVARGAVLDGAGSSLYVHSVAAGSRRDLGIGRVDLESGTRAQVMPPFEADEDFGPVFATSLRWSLDGSTLVVQSCGAEHCVTRLLDTTTATITTYAEPHGALVGLAGDTLIVFTAGHERPLPLLAVDLGDGAVREIVEDAYEADLLGTPDAPMLHVDTPAGWLEVAP